jgi:pyrimidine-nucleoside phosphorylase
MSKKIAGGCDALVLDVKYGSGSLVGSYENARELADIMIGIGKGAGVQTRAVLSDMNQPLGRYIGNALEVVEVVETLKGMHNDSRLLEVCFEIGSNMLELSRVANDLDHGKKLMKKAIADGSGLQKLKDMIEAQGGDSSIVDDTSKLPTARKIIDVTSDKAGKITAMDTKGIGRSAMLLGAGREKKQDEIDSAVGLVMECAIGDELKRGDVICTMHINDEINEQRAIRLFKDSIIIE